ncbi:MAG: IS1380 family transposase [Deltaproteobacteria bacterium]|nr:IS1380 family transposase [Deltaproteobacteria bacterium]
MSVSGERKKETLRPDFNRRIKLNFQGAKLSSDTGFLLLREIDERFGIIDEIAEGLLDSRSPGHTRHSIVQMIRQRVYQMAAGYEDCNDADFLRVDPALRLSLDKGGDFGASQSMLSRLENDILGNAEGLKALDAAVIRSADALIKKKWKYRFILDVDSTDDPTHGKQEGSEYNGHFRSECFHPIFAFTGEGDALAGVLRPGKVHSADGTLDLIKPLVDRYRKRFQLFWFRGDAAFAKPEIYDYCESKRVTYFIRLPQNEILKEMIRDDLRRPAGRWPRSGVKVRTFDFPYRAGTWSQDRRVVCKIEWHQGELFPRVGFIVTNSRLSSKEVVKTYNGRANVENRIKEGKNTLRWDKTSCHKFDANQARLKMGLLAYNLLHLLREFYMEGEEVKRSVEWLIRRVVKVAARVSYHSRYWWVHVASAFPLRHHYQAVLGHG